MIWVPNQASKLVSSILSLLYSALFFYFTLSLLALFGVFMEHYCLRASYLLFLHLRCVSWSIKKAERWRIDAFELWCWRRLLRVPWTKRRSKQSILKETNPEYSLDGPMLKMKLQYFGHLMQRTDSLEKTLMLAKIEGRRQWDNRAWDGWMASPTWWTRVWANSGRQWGPGKPAVLRSMGSQKGRPHWAAE